MGNLGGKSYPFEGEITPDEKTMGMLAHLLNLVALIGPLIIWLIKKDQSPYVAIQAKQAMFWGGLLFIGYFVSSLLICVMIGMLLFPIVAIANIVYLIVGTMKANEGLIYEYPITGNMAKG